MTKDAPSLGELEVHVLRYVWQEQPCTERQVWDLVRQERKIGRTTVLKTIQRLEAKGLLTRVARRWPGAVWPQSRSGDCCRPSWPDSSTAHWPAPPSPW